MKRADSDAGWFPAAGSYEEAVLGWQEQIEISFRSRSLGRHVEVSDDDLSEITKKDQRRLTKVADAIAGRLVQESERIDNECGMSPGEVRKDVYDRIRASMQECLLKALTRRVVQARRARSLGILDLHSPRSASELF